MSTWGVEEEVKRWIDFGAVDLMSVAATLLRVPLIRKPDIPMYIRYVCISVASWSYVVAFRVLYLTLLTLIMIQLPALELVEGSES